MASCEKPSWCIKKPDRDDPRDHALPETAQSHHVDRMAFQPGKRVECFLSFPGIIRVWCRPLPTPFM